MADDALFRLVDVRVAIDGVTILDGVDLAVPVRGITVVTGPSGAGKSTLLRLLNRLEVPTSGRVLMRGADLATLDPLGVRREVGMVFQRPALFPGTVRDNLLVAAPDASEVDLRAAVDQAELPRRFLDRDAAGLSGGEAQRACLARALAAHPRALLLDEPTSAVEWEATLAIEMLARHLADRGMPLVWVTHDLGQADRLADRRVAMAAGRVLRSEPAEPSPPAADPWDGEPGVRR